MIINKFAGGSQRGVTGETMIGYNFRAHLNLHKYESVNNWDITETLISSLAY